MIVFNFTLGIFKSSGYNVSDGSLAILSNACFFTFSIAQQSEIPRFCANSHFLWFSIIVFTIDRSFWRIPSGSFRGDFGDSKVSGTNNETLKKSVFQQSKEFLFYYIELVNKRSYLMTIFVVLKTCLNQHKTEFWNEN